MKLVVLDTGTLGLLTHPRSRPDALACRQWAQTLPVAGARVVVPGMQSSQRKRFWRPTAGDVASIAKKNARHLSRFPGIDAWHWSSITY